MDVAIKKVGERGGEERFILVNAHSRQVLTVNDVSESTLRLYFRQRGATDELIDACFARARNRYSSATEASAPVNQAIDTVEDDDLLFELGLDEDDDIH